MEKASKIDLDTTVKKIMYNEMGIVLLEADEKSMYDILAKKSTYNDRQGMYGNGYHIIYHLYPIMYINGSNYINNNLVKVRANAIHNIFVRWDELGYNKRHSNSPYGCKTFNKYLDEIEFLKADFLLLMVE